MQRICDYRISVNGRTVSIASENSASTSLGLRLCPPQYGGEIRVEAPFAMFSADALCATAYIQAVRRGEKDRCVVLAESSGLHSVIPVMVDPKTGTAAAGIPVPEVSREDGFLVLRFPGSVCCVGKADSYRGTEAPMIIVQRDEACSSVTAQARLTLNDAFKPISSSGLAAAAAAIDYAAAQPDGITEYEIGMSGRTIGVGVVIREGKLAGLSVSSVVELQENP